MADGLLGQALFKGDFGQQRLGPDAGVLAEGARRLMQDLLQLLQMMPRQLGVGALGATGLGRQTLQPRGVKGADNVTHILLAAAVGGCNLERDQTLCTGEQVLGAAQPKGIGGMQGRFELTAFALGEGTDRERWFHATILPDP